MHDIVVITSVYSPMELYQELVSTKERQIDTFRQFECRLSVIYQTTMTTINEVVYNGSIPTFNKLKGNPYSELSRPRNQQQHQKARQLLDEV